MNPQTIEKSLLCGLSAQFLFFCNIWKVMKPSNSKWSWDSNLTVEVWYYANWPFIRTKQSEWPVKTECNNYWKIRKTFIYRRLNKDQTSIERLDWIAQYFIGVINVHFNSVFVNLLTPSTITWGRQSPI